MPVAEDSSVPVSRPLSGLFVAGSGTDVGKTVVTAALLRALVLAGVRVQAVKPVQTGVAPQEAHTAPLADARVYLALAQERLGADWINPARFRIGASALFDALLAELDG